jgi:hypothetical protein
MLWQRAKSKMHISCFSAKTMSLDAVLEHAFHWRTAATRLNIVQVPISSTFYFAQLFSNYSLALYFFGARILAQKLLVKC